MSEYKGIKYKQIGNGKWLVVWPSGIRGTVAAKTEDEFKKKIDSVIGINV